VVAFAVEQAFYKQKRLQNLPIIKLEEIEKFYPVGRVKIFCAVGYGALNTRRERLIKIVKEKNYQLASYISKQANISKSAFLGEHLFIFENNVIQPFSEIQENVILWSGNHIGHHTTIHKNVFITSHVVVSGATEIKRNCFLGVNSAISNNLIIEKFNWVGPGVILQKSTEPYEMWKIKSDFSLRVDSKKIFNLKHLQE